MDRRASFHAMTAAVVAGGLSTRMGRDKALIRRASGETWLGKAVALARGMASRILIVTGEQMKYDNLFGSDDVEIYPDDEPNCGPLGGLLTALRRTTSEFLICFTCDMPSLTNEVVRTIPRPESGEDAVYVERSYFPIVLRTGADIIRTLELRLKEGKRDVGGFLRGLRSREIAVDNEGALQNLNRPQDLSPEDVA